MSISLRYVEKGAKGFAHSAWSGESVFEADVVKIYPTDREYYGAHVSISEVNRFVTELRRFANGEEAQIPSSLVEHRAARFQRCVLCDGLMWPILHDGLSIEVMTGTMTMGGETVQHYHRSCAGSLADRLDAFVEENAGMMLANSF